MLNRILKEMIPRVNTYYASCTPPIPTLVLDLSNNNENLPLGLVKHDIDKWEMADLYRAANPHPSTGIVPYRTDVLNISKFLQTEFWPYCSHANRCRKKTIVYRPDLAVKHQEAVSVWPPNSTPYCVPLFIIEVEGQKTYGGQGSKNIKPSKRQRGPWPSCPTLTYCLYTTIGSSFGMLYVIQSTGLSM